MRASLYLALLPLLFGLAAAFSVHPQAAGDIKPTTQKIAEKNRNNNQLSSQIEQSTRSVIVSTVVAALIFAVQPLGAFAESGGHDFQNNQIIISSSNTVATSSTQSTITAFSSLQLSNSMASPMGEFKPETDTGISPGFSSFGQWFFLLYVVVSLLAGAKEVGGRIMNQMNKDE